MKLKKAITRAAALCSTGDQIMFQMTTGNGRIVVINEQFTVFLSLDEKCPNLTVDGKQLAAAVRGMGNVIHGGIQGDKYVLSGEKEALSLSFLAALPVRVPPVPYELFQDIPRWEEIQQVFHAAASSKHKVRTVLRKVCFGCSGTGATDESMIAFVGGGIGQGQLIQAEAFAKWPKGPVRGFMDNSYAWFSVGDETRVVNVEFGEFPRVPLLLKSKDVFEFSAEFNTKELLASVKAMTTNAKRKQIRIQGTGATPGFVVLAVQPKENGSRFAKPLRGELGKIDVLIDGSKLQAALTSFVGDVVRIRYSKDAELPLRIEGDTLSEDIYTLMEVA